jgi:hypothetical protein
LQRFVCFKCHNCICISTDDELAAMARDKNGITDDEMYNRLYSARRQQRNARMICMNVQQDGVVSESVFCILHIHTHTLVAGE